MTAEDKINIQLAEVRHNQKIKFHNERHTESHYQSVHEEAISECQSNAEATIAESTLSSESHSTSETTNNENAPQLRQTNHHWPRGTTLIVGDSMLGGIQERLIGPRGNIKVRSFPGANTDDMKDYIRPLLRKCPDRVVLHVGTNDAIQYSPDEIVQRILSVKTFIEHELKDCDVIISSPINRLDSQNLAVKIRNANAILKSVGEINLLSNDNIVTKHLGMKKLHLNMSGTKLLVTNILCKLRSL